jgi:hypothetical protein
MCLAEKTLCAGNSRGDFQYEIQTLPVRQGFTQRLFSLLHHIERPCTPHWCAFLSFYLAEAEKPVRTSVCCCSLMANVATISCGPEFRQVLWSPSTRSPPSLYTQASSGRVQGAMTSLAGSLCTCTCLWHHKRAFGHLAAAVSTCPPNLDT